MKKRKKEKEVVYIKKEKFDAFKEMQKLIHKNGK